jgi:uncharacterized protein involved in exopolysaccharide biosynthesis
VLQTRGLNDSYDAAEPMAGFDQEQSPGLDQYLDIFKRRFFYFLIPFILASIPALYFASIEKPSYVSEGTILLETQTIAPDIVRPVLTAKIDDRLQSIQQRVITRETLLSVANRWNLFPHQLASDVVEKMRKMLQMKPTELGQPRAGATTVAFTVGFENENPEVAMGVATELVSLLVGEDTRSRTNSATEAVKMLTDQARDIEGKLDATKSQMMEIAQRPRDPADDGDQQELQMSAIKDLAALKAELVQKSAVYSDAHPVVKALKKRIASMERTITQPSRAQSQSQSRAAEMEALKRQREVLETRLAEANSKLASARLGENEEQRSDRMQVIEEPSLPHRPNNKLRFKIAGILFAGAAIIGFAAAIGSELIDGSIKGRGQLSGVVASAIVVCIPFLPTRADVMRKRLRMALGAVGAALVLVAWGGLATAIVLNVPPQSLLTF